MSWFCVHFFNIAPIYAYCFWCCCGAGKGIYTPKAEGRHIAEARKQGKYKGRKAKKLPEFEAVYNRWKNGEITAVKAMSILGVSKSSFYRKVKSHISHEVDR